MLMFSMQQNEYSFELLSRWFPQRKDRVPQMTMNDEEPKNAPVSTQYTFRPLTRRDIASITTWRYDGPYAIYNGETLKTGLLFSLRLHSLLRLLGYEGFAVDDERGELVGIFQFTRTLPRTITIGLGLRPDYTGRGGGLAFVESGLAFGRERYAPKTFRLLVATFNERALKVYTRAGFKKIREIAKTTLRGREMSYEMRREEAIVEAHNASQGK